MITKLIKLALVFAFVANSQIGYAFVDPPVLISPNPVAGDLVLIDVTAGACDGLGGAPPTITQTGNDIQMLIQSIHSFDNEYCIYPTYTTHFSVGAFEPGEYTMQVDRIYLGDNGSVIETIGSLAFTVTALASAPALGIWSQALMLCALLMAALIALRQSYIEIREE